MYISNEILTEERSYQASFLIDLRSSGLVKQISDQEMIVKSNTENLPRENPLNQIEEADSI